MGGLTAGGTDGANYTMGQQATLQAVVTPAPLSITGITTPATNFIIPSFPHMALPLNSCYHHLVTHPSFPPYCTCRWSTVQSFDPWWPVSLSTISHGRRFRVYAAALDTS